MIYRFLLKINPSIPNLSVAGPSKKLMLTAGLLCSIYSVAMAGNASIKGLAVNSYTKAPLPGITVILKGMDFKSTTDSLGHYSFTNVPPRKYTVVFYKESYFNTERDIDLKEDEALKMDVYLNPKMIELQAAQVSSSKATSAASSSVISALDMELRPRNSAQDLLKSVPGIFTAQHQGGAKAEQMFVRGFDCDHGTDINLSLDGVPVNLPSHAHGQGYADMHFLIADVVSSLDVYKGPYQAQFGDFYTGAAVAFHTYDTLPHSLVHFEVGTAPTQRAFENSRVLFMTNIPTHNTNISSYIAGEYSYNPGYFDNDAHYSKFNIFGKIKYKIAQGSDISLSIASYAASWNGSGQIPVRAVSEGLISRFGSLDPTEGGSTDRTMVNLQYRHNTGNGQFLFDTYYQRYGLTLYNDFTFFLVDPVHGDEIEQDDTRNVIGFNTQYSKYYNLGDIQTKSTFGGGMRTDIISTDLWHVEKRVRLNQEGADDIYVTGTNLWFKQDFNIVKWFRFDAAVRFDYMIFQDRDNQPTDTPNHSGTNYQVLPSYKVNFVFSPTDAVQLFVNNGIGYHSNDTRIVVEDPRHTLPTAFAEEVGTTVRVGTMAIFSAALYCLDLTDERTFDPDVAQEVDNGPSRRMGVDFTARIQILPWLTADLDLNYSHNYLTQKFLGREATSDYELPLAPVFTSQGGLTARHRSGFKARIGYRAMSNRPADVDYSVTALGYYVMDASLAFERRKYMLSLTVENFLNTKWNEAQFATVTQLQGETQPVNSLCFTAGTPIAIKFGVSYYFR
jgi:hypothetical protein